MRAGVAVLIFLTLAGCVTTKEGAPQVASDVCIKGRQDTATEAAKLRQQGEASAPMRDYYLRRAATLEKDFAALCPSPSVVAISMGGEACNRATATEIGRVEAGDRLAVIDAALCWIEQHSPYKDLSAPRFVFELNQEEMRQRSVRAGFRSFAAAMYNCNDQAMYIPAGTNLALLEPQSVLVHELVHHAQCSSRRAFGDGCDWEREAYAMQAKFVRYVAETRSTQLGRDTVQQLFSAAEKIEAYAVQSCADRGVVSRPK